LALIGFGGWWMYWPQNMDDIHGQISGVGNHIVSVSVPDLSTMALLGEKLFNSNCAACHGQNAAGSDQGPPLVHRIYEPNHHGDASFYLAVQRGVQAHHWRFGNMQAVEGVSERDVEKIVLYVRELQRANGIF
jgi:mono/diheme cytochrome c family protein